MARFDSQVGAMLFKNMTIFKSMFSAILIGMIGMYTLHDWGLIEFQVKPTIIAPLIIGGIMFRIRWTLLGYCP